jgi:P27 family predicted phage terminase small subunit
MILPANPPIFAAPVPVKLPHPPRNLGAPGRACWRKTWKAAGKWLVLASDGPVVERYAALHDEVAELRDLIADRGRVGIGSMGQPVTAPAVEQLRAVERLLLEHERVLGLGPLSRSRLGLAVLQVEEKADLIAQLRAERQGPS